MTLDKHIESLYRDLRDSNHTGTRLLADHIDDMYRTSESITAREVLRELDDEIGTLQLVLTKMSNHLEKYREEHFL